MQGLNRSLKLRYFFFIASIVLTIVATQLIVQYDLDQQTEDSRLINVAGRQRMLSQRISKLILFLNYRSVEKSLPVYYNQDSLGVLLDQWEDANQYLINQNERDRKSELIRNLLNENTPRLQQISAATKKILSDPGQHTLQQAIDVLTVNELPFLLTMEKTVATYQQEAEDKLRYLKKVELILAAVAIGILSIQFVFIFYPIINRLSKNNLELKHLNEQLGKANQELVSSEEEIRANLDQISALQEHLESSEKLHRELITGATDMIYELDENGSFSFVNPVMEKVTGYSRSDLIGMLYSDLVHEDDRARVTEFYLNQVKSGSEVSYLELRIRNSLREIVWVGQNVRLQFDDGKNKVFRVIVVARDISKLKEAEIKLSQERLLLRTIIDNIPINIYVKDAKSRKVLANKAEVEYAGATQETELLGKSDWDLYPPETAQISIEEDTRVLAGESMINMETFSTRNDGSIRWFLSSKIPLRDSDHKVVGLVGISINITDSKLASEELKVAKEKAEQATLAKSQFLSNMSHEIRTPMNGIMGMTDLLLGSDPRPDQQEKLKLLKFSCDNLLTIINDILDFNKIEAGKIELENISFSLHEILDYYVTLMNVRAQEKGLELRLIADANLPFQVLGDPVRLGQVLNNLIGNAIKFTEKGFVELSVKLIDSQSGKQNVRFAVKDSGIGIDADNLNSVFERFTQASSDTTRKFGGTGLGLSITKSLVELMGSTIQLESKPGIGSTFYFTLSFVEVAPDHRIKAQSGNKTQEKLHILLVEDNRVNQLVAAGFLKQWGHEVTFAANGKDALTILESNQFDLILMDLQMPEMDGYEATRLIRNKPDKYSKTVPIIAITADVVAEVREKVYTVGMTGYLSKPLKVEELQRLVSNSRKSTQAFQPANQLKGRIHYYTEGDPEFTREFVMNMLANLVELKTVLLNTFETGQSEGFSKIHHKCKTTLSILAFETLNVYLDRVNQLAVQGNLHKQGIEFQSKIVAEIEAASLELKKEIT